MNRWMATILLIVGATMLQGCAYDPYAGAYVPYSAYGYSGYSTYGSYGYPGYGTYGYPGYGGYYGGSVVTGGGWGGGDRGGDWDRRYSAERHEGGNRPVNLGTGYQPPHQDGGPRAAPAAGGRQDRDRNHDGDDRH